MIVSNYTIIVDESHLSMRISQNGWAPLHVAAKEKSSSYTAELLIRSGADVNAREDDVSTLLTSNADLSLLPFDFVKRQNNTTNVDELI